MNNIQTVIERINNGRLPKTEVLKYLDSQNILVKFNTIVHIIRNKIVDDDVLQKLSALSLQLNEEPVLTGIWTNAHVAIAALKIMNTIESVQLYNKAFPLLNTIHQNKLDNLIHMIQDVL